MMNLRRLLPLLLIFFCLAAPLCAAASTTDQVSKIAQLEAQNKQLHQQLRQARRDLALERNREQEAGWPQLLGGIGIIFGLCGVGMMISARKQMRGEG
ncbi:MAG: hypothetical protein L3J63_13240 [Geopsychrobacter sp.]|nr:hypothetical protein [Geopsychrobacter sp.]